MGYYIQIPESRNKAEQLVELYPGAEIVSKPHAYFNIPAGKALVCVVDNGLFEGAALCYNKEEFEVFSDTHTDFRPRKWVLMDKVLAYELAGYKEA